MPFRARGSRHGSASKNPVLATRPHSVARSRMGLFLLQSSVWLFGMPSRLLQGIGLAIWDGVEAVGHGILQRGSCNGNVIGLS